MRRSIYLTLICILGLLAYWSIVIYGEPFSFHPDEHHIYKRPFKLLLNYANGDYSGRPSLFTWVQLAWTALVYVFGLVAGLWNSVADFKTALVMEDWSIFLSYRCLSLFLVFLGHYFMIKKLTLTCTSDSKMLAYSLVIIFNPVLLLSFGWIKYEALVYLLIAFGAYGIERWQSSRMPTWQLAILFGAMLATRIDLWPLVILFAAYLVFKRDYRTGTNRKELFGAVVVSLLCFVVITLMPLQFLDSLWQGNSDGGIKDSANYGALLFERLSFELANEGGRAWSKSLFYPITLLLVYFPIAMVLIKGRSEGQWTDKLYLLFGGLVLVLIMVHGQLSVHYLLIPSSMLILASMRSIKRLSLPFIVSAMFYVVSISLSLIWRINDKTDNRFLALNSIIEYSSSSDCLLIEDLRVHGFHPPVSECREGLLEKYEATIDLGKSTGATLLQKAAHADSVNCRKLKVLGSKDYYRGSTGEGRFVIEKSAIASGAIAFSDLKEVDMAVLRTAEMKTAVPHLIDGELQLSLKRKALMDPRAELLMSVSNYVEQEFDIIRRQNSSQ